MFWRFANIVSGKAISLCRPGVRFNPMLDRPGLLYRSRCHPHCFRKRLFPTRRSRGRLGRGTLANLPSWRRKRGEAGTAPVRPNQATEAWKVVAHRARSVVAGRSCRPQFTAQGAPGGWKRLFGASRLGSSLGRACLVPGKPQRVRRLQIGARDRSRTCTPFDKGF